MQGLLALLGGLWLVVRMADRVTALGRVLNHNPTFHVVRHGPSHHWSSFPDPAGAEGKGTRCGQTRGEKMRAENATHTATENRDRPTRASNLSVNYLMCVCVFGCSLIVVSLSRARSCLWCYRCACVRVVCVVVRTYTRVLELLLLVCACARRKLGRSFGEALQSDLPIETGY